VKFQTRADGSVFARFHCETRYEGYRGCLHGGIVAMLLDAAMTHCLFARDVEAVTAKLALEYKRPTSTDAEVLVQAHLTKASPPLYHLEAVLVQSQQIRARASATFYRPEVPPEELPR
jgi:acyl-coenzyme A thioesterase PaaI-like protein